MRADRLTDALRSRAWNRISAGAGPKGERDYDWAWIAITPPAGETGGCHSLLVRRRRHQARAKTSHYRRRGHAIHQPVST